MLGQHCSQLTVLIRKCIDRILSSTAPYVLTVKGKNGNGKKGQLKKRQRKKWQPENWATGKISNEK